jgi:hypothetical protein
MSNDEEFYIPDIPEEWRVEFVNFVNTGNMSNELREFLKNNPEHQGLVNFINEIHAEVFLEKVLKGEIND